MHPNDRLCLRHAGLALLVRHLCAHVKSADRNPSSGERSGSGIVSGPTDAGSCVEWKER